MRGRYDLRVGHTSRLYKLAFTSPDITGFTNPQLSCDTCLYATLRPIFTEEPDHIKSPEYGQITAQCIVCPTATRPANGLPKDVGVLQLTVASPCNVVQSRPAVAPGKATEMNLRPRLNEAWVLLTTY